jgi:type III restriction enzyme
MSKFSALSFQATAIQELTATFKKLWSNSERQRPILFESPTGSGKTFMLCQFINGLNRQPDWDADKAYIWITFSDDLAMQSKEKFKEYFFPNLNNELLTVEDFREGKLNNNDILYMNWQKVVSKAAENRKLRRPDDTDRLKESGYYFEDVIENTKADEREIVLIIDESHLHENSDLAKQIINKIDPKIILYVSATPNDYQKPSASDVKKNRSGYVSTERDEVVEEGLIKERVITQTEEDLAQFEITRDMDEKMLDLAIAKKAELDFEFKQLNKAINPLVLIQLPNDDKLLKDSGQKTKEEIVMDYLLKCGVQKEKIALKFTDKVENFENITKNDNSVDFMLFKVAAGTGWDCPRAHVLVMFREVKSSKFATQVIGRILRMPEPHLKDDYKNNNVLKTGYLFTNYKRNEVSMPEQTDGNKPSIYVSKRKEGITNIELQSDFVSRVDYGDLSSTFEFQKSFLNTFNAHFDIDNQTDLIDARREKIAAKSIDINPKVTNSMIVNAVFEDYDKLNLEYRTKGRDKTVELSANDIEKMFTYACFQLLREQTEADAKISNIARSWSPLKTSFREWFRQNLSDNSDIYYKVLIHDLQKEASSVFRPILTQALKDYRPILNKLIEKRKKAAEKREAPVFTIQKEYAFTEDYELFDTKLCVLDKFYHLKDYKGKVNETNFINYLESKTEQLEWWFKNGSSGKDAYCFKYKNTSTEEESLFYPDWILKFKDGKIGIFDTKGGNTATNTEGRAEALAKKIKTLNAEGLNIIGGIALQENAQWYFNCSENYQYVKGKLGEDWQLLEKLF